MELTGTCITERDGMIVIKLDNGYNIGVDPSACRWLERPEAAAPRLAEVLQDPALPGIAIISTGGTIASRIDYRTGAVTSQFNADDILRAIPRLAAIAHYRTHQVCNILSENMNPSIWQELAHGVYDMTALHRGLLDACVTACEGAGTVITSSPTLAQGIGSRISGLVETTPIPELISRIEKAGGTVLDPKTAALDQVAGVEKAVDMGHKQIGVSVVCAPDVRKMRQLEKEHGVEIVTFGVHVTGMGHEEAKELINLVDITTGCSSGSIREHIKGHALAQFGTAIPIFAITQRGKEMLLERAKEVTDPVLINTMKLPVLPEDKQPRPLI